MFFTAETWSRGAASHLQKSL